MRTIITECLNCFKPFDYECKTAHRKYCNECIEEKKTTKCLGIKSRINMYVSPYLPSKQTMVWDDVNCLDGY